ncbi:hypothetical protein [Candidatus Vondammii sp. HM_W22]|uniref:hypothetical protein n=1 Tax=Candidatus Vondammii sp. HM_W22 TaxID=2687299 RepID=UPI002E7C2D36|nr:hypothetical protein [Candidatus Vondammii sp. HM_W22]
MVLHLLVVHHRLVVVADPHGDFFPDTRVIVMITGTTVHRTVAGRTAGLDRHLIQSGISLSAGTRPGFDLAGQGDVAFATLRIAYRLVSKRLEPGRGAVHLFVGKVGATVHAVADLSLYQLPLHLVPHGGRIDAIDQPGVGVFLLTKFGVEDFGL